MNVRRPYRSDVSDARWALIEPVFTAWRASRTGPGTAARVHDLREIVNAILYVNLLRCVLRDLFEGEDAANAYVDLR